MRKITERCIRMMTKQGFVEVFWETLKDTKMTHEECYEVLEKEYVSAFSRRRYSNFMSFRRKRDEK